MSTPKVTVLFADGGLLQDIAAIDSIAGLVMTGSTVGLLGSPMVFNSLAEFEEAGITADDEAFAHKHLKEFYDEVGGNQKLYVMLVPDTMSMATMLTNSDASGAKKLTMFAGGEIRLLGVARKPGVGYNGGTDLIDSDVAAALLTSKVFAEARLAELTPLRILIEGRVQNPNAANTLQPKNSTNGYTGVVLGGSQSDGSASVGLALGRACKYAAHIKVGKVANGPLQLNTAYIGSKKVEERTDLDTLHGAGFISFMKHPNKAGYFFGIDRMASVNDYRLLAYGRIVDKAAVIAAAVYIEDLESEVSVGVDGKIDSLELAAMETRIRQQINLAMGGQISGLEVYINPSQDIINSSTLVVKLRVRPLGYKSFIEVDLGLVAPTVS